MTGRPRDAWSIPFGDRWVIPQDQAIVGWRYAQVGMARGQLVLSPFWPDRGADLAACLHSHRPGPAHSVRAPAPGCGCGYRVVRDLAVLAGYRRRIERTAANLGAVIPPAAYVKVAGWGACTARQGEDERDETLDPVGCVRVERLDPLGPVLLPGPMAALAPRLRANYRGLHDQVIVIDG